MWRHCNSEYWYPTFAHGDVHVVLDIRAQIWHFIHYNDVIISVIASQITSLTIVYSTFNSGEKSKKTSKLRVTGICAGYSPHKGPVTRKMLPFDDVIMTQRGPQWSDITPTLPLHEFIEMLCIIIAVKPEKRHGVSNHRQLECLSDRLFALTSKKTSKFRIACPLVGRGGGGTHDDQWIPLRRGQ